MLKQIINWLNNPYYIPNFSAYNVIISAAFGLIVSVFLIIFQPFRIPLLGDYVELFCIGYGLISTITLLLLLYLLPIIFKSFFDPEKRTVFKQFILLNIIIIIIGSFSWYYNLIVRSSINQEIIAGYFKMLLYTYVVGFFPMFFWVYFDELILRKRREKRSREIIKTGVESLDDQINEIQVFGDNNKGSITFDLNKLIYISSFGNYASFYIDTKKGVKELTIRKTLTNIISELKENENIIRCHKSYIINSFYMDAISGNARGYFLSTLLTSDKIPVSRKINKENLKKLIH